MTPPFRVGIDLVQISRVQESLDRFRGRFLRRIYTPQELADCEAAPALLVLRLATRFAAKEATIKVLRPGAPTNAGREAGAAARPERDAPSVPAAVAWRSIEVRRQPAGHGELVLTGDAERLARAAGIGGFSLSMSHEGDYATAIVLAWSAHPEGIRS
jgi:holo-[acyl-carrier protein] synthase